MSFALLGLLMDVLVLGFIGTMIYYCFRLARSLNDFRAHRQEFDTMLIKLIGSIDQAERAIANLKQAGAKESEELQRLIKQSKAMSEELQIINEAGENMAKRLEELAEKNRKAVQNVDLQEPPSVRFKQNPSQKKMSPERDDFPAFMREKVENPPPHSAPPKSEKGEPADPQFQSQAERDLYEALRRQQKNLGLKGRT